MRLVLTIFGLMMVLMFGVIAAIDTSSTVNAGRTSPTATLGCHDDGDDDPPSNPEPVDGPDEEENNPQEQNPDDRDEEFADTDDEDPAYEEDDDNECPLGPTGVLGETETPQPTPCPTPDFGDQGDQCCPEFPGSGSAGLCCVDDVEAAGFCCSFYDGVTGQEPPPCQCLFPPAEVGAEGPGICCLYFPIPECCLPLDEGLHADLIDFCYCYLGADDDVDAEQIDLCCIIYNICFGNLSAGPGDADCDGAVTASDAYATLAALSGVSAAAGGCSPGGDADCSGAVDPLDTLAILKVVAGLSAPATC